MKPIYLPGFQDPSLPVLLYVIFPCFTQTKLYYKETHSKGDVFFELEFIDALFSHGKSKKKQDPYNEWMRKTGLLYILFLVFKRVENFILYLVI